MSVDLEVLRTNREALLLAEVVAWLHDMGKGADEHVIHQSSDCPSGHSYSYKTAYSNLVPSALNVDLSATLSESISVRDLIEQARPRIVRDTSRMWLLRVLGRCHAAAHIEKEETDGGKQLQSDTRLSSVFGYESPPLSGLTSRLTGLPFHSLNNRSVSIKAIRTAFTEAPGDTRRPENEVTLWGWSSIVAALYKTALAGALLGYRPAPSDVKWRLLSVKTNKSFVYSQTSRIPDLLARRKILADAFECVRVLLEETYPLGTQVYQDENNSLYVVPNLADLLELPDKHGVTLRELIHTEFSKGTLKGHKDSERISISGETVSALQLDSREWWGQRPSRTSADEVPPVAETLQDEASASADPQQITSWWENRQGDICSVCGLRPQGSLPKSLTRKVCDVCEQRREDRSKEWAANLKTTIWIDEVADINSRLALVVGQFAIDDWLKPDGMIRTLLIKPLTAGSAAAKKNVSFARLQRVWETTRLFWDQSASSLGEQVGKVSPRLQIEAEYRPSSTDSDTLAVSHSYEIKIENQRLSVVCVKKGEFLTAENLRYLAKQFDPEQGQEDYNIAAMFVRDALLKKGEFDVEEPTGYGNPNKLRGKLKIKSVTLEATPYVPAITILAEPRNFMALVPADKALNVVEAIKTKYEIEMGKVRNRLPLTVGVVFAGSRTPLAALLDAGRRMLKFKSAEKKWKVIKADDDSFKTGVDTAGNEIRTPSRRLDLESDDPIPKRITWHIPNKMGDGTTLDEWYPYFFTDAALDAIRRMFQSPDSSRQLIHVGDLKDGGTDEVWVQPSTFDFEFLNSAAQRFEVSYKDGKRRSRERQARPYYLEEIEDFQKIWKVLEEGLATSQIKTLGELIEAKRREWFDEADTLNDEQRKELPKTFRRFVEAAITNAKWKNGMRPKDDKNTGENEFSYFVEAALRGQLADVIELYMQILKQKSKVD